MHDCKDNRVFIIMRKDLVNTTIIKKRTKLLNHTYGIVMNITEEDFYSRG